MAIVKRRKNIILHDSWMSYNGVFFNRSSRVINPRNPLQKVEPEVNYDLESEDEWNEQNYDDLEDEKLMLEEDDDSEIYESDSESGNWLNGGILNKLACRA